MKKLSVPLLLLAAFAALAGCASENPDLVNPPPGLDSIYVRFVNFAADRTPRSLSLESLISTGTVGFGQSSAIIQSPEDSARISINNGQTAELTTPTRFRFTRSSFLTVVAVPSGSNAPVSRPFDTIIVLTTLAAPSSSVKNEASVRLCNVSPDTNVTYSLKLGCQNGTEIARDGGFRTISAYTEIPSGQTGITLLRNVVGAPEPTIVGLFAMAFEARKSYSFFVFDNSPGNPGLLVLDDRSMGADALKPLLPVAERTAEMQVFNFSRRELTALKVSNGAAETVAAGLVPLGVSEMKQVAACGSLTTDQTLALTAAGDTAGRGYFSLEVLRKYNVFWFDKPTSTDFSPVIVRRSTEPKADMATITVINGAFSQGAVTVSLGARTNSKQPSGYSSGEILSSRLAAGNFADPVFIPAGELPVTVFSTTLPARMLLAAPATVLPGKQYYLVLRDNAAAAGGVEAALVEETEANTQAAFLAQGGFVQVLNAASGADNVTVGFDRILSNARVPFIGSVATILPVGGRNFTAGGANAALQITSDSSILVIAAGQVATPDIFHVSGVPGGNIPGVLRRRYINAASDIAGMSIAFDADSAPPIAENIAYRSTFDEPPLNYSRRISVYFLETATKRPLDSIQNVSLSLGRNYSLILTGGGGKYHVVVQQEF